MSGVLKFFNALFSTDATHIVDLSSVTPSMYGGVNLSIFYISLCLHSVFFHLMS
jgi:hypothetical protein